jgi:hypothetical protein
MFWFCSGHFAATWLVCMSLLCRFLSMQGRPVTFVLFALVLWPLLLGLLPWKGYWHLKRITLDRLKARVSRGELKKAVVFAFGFCTSLLAAASIGFASWLVGKLDALFAKYDGWMSIAHQLAWFPLAFALWVLLPMLAVRRLAREQKQAAPMQAEHAVAA